MGSRVEEKGGKSLGGAGGVEGKIEREERIRGRIGMNEEMEGERTGWREQK